MEHLIHLVAGSGALALLTAILWPRGGLLDRVRRSRQRRRKAAVEDGLRYLYESEYQRVPPTVVGLAGALRLTPARASAVLALIEEMGLVRRDGTDVLLTPGGRRYALRVIRIHRLWEQHLAEQTGVRAQDWHVQADAVEHRVSPKEVDDLAAQLGHPRFDPHGAPIPTADGELPPARRDRALNALSPGRPGTVVHIEDEPPEVFAQLTAQGIQTGSRVQVLEVTADRVHLLVDGEEHVLAPIMAANVSVRDIGAVAESTDYHSLADLQSGQRGRVIRVAPACRGMERQRLMDLGIVPGTEIAAEMASPSGNPVAYRVRGSLIALRRSQAQLIQMDVAGDAGE